VRPRLDLPAAGSLASAPSAVSGVLPLLTALASSAPSTPPRPAKRRLALYDLLPGTGTPTKQSRAPSAPTRSVKFADGPPDIIEYCDPPAPPSPSASNRARRQRMKNMKRGLYRQTQFLEKRTADDADRFRELREQLAMTSADLFHHKAPWRFPFTVDPDAGSPAQYDPMEDDIGDYWIGFHGTFCDQPGHASRVPALAAERDPPMPASSCSQSSTCGHPEEPDVPMQAGIFPADVGIVTAEINRYVLFGTLDLQTARVGDLRKVLAEHMPQHSIPDHVLREAMVRCLEASPAQPSQSSGPAHVPPPEPASGPMDSGSLETRLQAAFDDQDFEAMHQLYKPAKRSGASKRLLRKVRHLLDLDVSLCLD